MRFAALGSDLVDQGLELVERAPSHARDVAFLGEALGNRAAGGVTGSDHENGLFGCHVPCSVSLVDDRLANERYAIEVAPSTLAFTKRGDHVV